MLMHHRQPLLQWGLIPLAAWTSLGNHRLVDSACKPKAVVATFAKIARRSGISKVHHQTLSTSTNQSVFLAGWRCESSLLTVTASQKAVKLLKNKISANKVCPSAGSPTTSSPITHRWGHHKDHRQDLKEVQETMVERSQQESSRTFRSLATSTRASMHKTSIS